MCMCIIMKLFIENKKSTHDDTHATRQLDSTPRAPRHRVSPIVELDAGDSRVRTHLARSVSMPSRLEIPGPRS